MTKINGLHFGESSAGQRYAVAINASGSTSVPLGPSFRDRVAAALYVAENGGWVSGHALTPGGTPWGTSRERDLKPKYQARAESFLAAMAE